MRNQQFDSFAGWRLVLIADDNGDGGYAAQAYIVDTQPAEGAKPERYDFFRLGTYPSEDAAYRRAYDYASSWIDYNAKGRSRRALQDDIRWMDSFIHDGLLVNLELHWRRVSRVLVVVARSEGEEIFSDNLYQISVGVDLDFDQACELPAVLGLVALAKEQYQMLSDGDRTLIHPPVRLG